MRSVITLTSDFGLCDCYVASMKGLILSINPEANIVDISHEIKPQDIHQAAFVLAAAAGYFPPESIHVVVVDPGVGTERSAISVKTAFGSFVTPDNGSLSYVLKPFLISPSTSKGSVSVKTCFKDELALEAVRITDRSYCQSPVSNTFHGRDIFAPAAAHLSIGENLFDFGEEADTIEMLPLSQPHINADGSITGQIIHIDSFGNLVTDVTVPDITMEHNSVIIEVGSKRIKGISKTYAEGEKLLAYIGSGGYLEIAVKNGSAACLLAVKKGDAVKLCD